MNFKQLNQIQTDADDLFFHSQEILNLLRTMPGFAGVKSKALDLRKAVEYLVKEVNTWEVDDE